MVRIRSSSIRSSSSAAPGVFSAPVAAYTSSRAASDAGSHAHESAEVGAFNMADLEACTTGLSSDPTFRLAQTVLSRVSMGQVLDQRQIMDEDVMVFSDRITMEGSPVTNQLRSGRCWLFATTNVIRTFTAKKHKLDNFQLSQSYLAFVDHLSKANWFLEQMIDLVDERLDSRTLQYLLANSEAQDGGQYDMAVNLIETFGLVPQSIYPESWNTSHSKELDTFLASKLREYGLELRNHLLQERKHLKRRTALRGARELKMEFMKEVYRILATCCGTPPLPNEKFIWEFIDTNKQYQRIVTTPIDFARSLSGYDVSATMSIINDPRHAYEAVYTVQRLGNVVGGRPVRYLNLDVETMKDIVVDLIKSDIPVWMGCDVDKASNLKKGVMDTKLYNYSDAFGTAVTMNKRERLESGDSAMSHAMVITAVHLDPMSHKPVRFRIQNSWGPEACDKGFIVMSASWFDENVFQIAAPRSHVPSALRKIYDHAEAVELPPWDPLGALA